jgi:two-component system, sensor histidine kinase and response regulator
VDLFLIKPFKIETLIKIIETKITRFYKIRNFNPNVNANFIREINTPLDGILDSINVLRDPKKE